MKTESPSLLRRIWHRMFPPVPDFLLLVADQSRLLEHTLGAVAAFLAQPRGEDSEAIRKSVSQANALAQSNLDLLHRSFVTPIDREDIYMLITRVDHVFDYCETSVRELEMLEVSADPWMTDMLSQLREGAAALTEGIEAFRTKRNNAEALSARARRSEREVETLYRDALAELFAIDAAGAIADELAPLSTQGCIELVFDRMKRREVYRHLSNAADRIAHAGEALHDLIVKYA